MLTTITLILAALVLSLLAVAMGWVLGWANKAFYVEVDPKVASVNAALPGANCGGCGYVGCMEYAEAVAAGEADITLCGPGGASCVEQMGAIMGKEVGETFPYRAVIHCAANRDARLQLMPYTGEPTCAAANLVAGVQGCTYGCLGLGDCATACTYDAIDIKNGLAVINYDKCVGCKACAVVCPRNIITMVPFRQERMLVVACCNQDAGNDVKAVCKVGCIGCKACTRNSPLFHMEGNAPVIDYDHYTPEVSFDMVLSKCPMESLIFVGKPSPKDLAKTEGEHVPERIEADFKTTVDETEWRG